MNFKDYEIHTDQDGDTMIVHYVPGCSFQMSWRFQRPHGFTTVADLIWDCENHDCGANP